MERNEFLSKFGIGLVAVCTGCALSSCGGSKSNDPSPNNTGGVSHPSVGSGPIFTADLNSELTTVGQTKTANGVILARIATGNTTNAFTAVQVACTHEGTSINYNAGQGIFICPLHGSEFNTAGNVIMGPAAQNLQKYNIAISGTTLTVSA